MNRFFTPNLDRKGRWLRVLMGIVLLGGALYSAHHSLWLGAALAAAGAFTLLEAVRGWCLLRACGLRTKW